MYIETEYNYGADADGNRGVNIYYVELEDTKAEREEIADELFEYFLEGCGGDVTLYYEDFEYEVSIDDYTDELIELFKEREEELKEEDEEIVNFIREEYSEYFEEEN